MATTASSFYWWHRYTSQESFQRILDGEDPWIAVGDFLDEWRREDVKDRCELVVIPLAQEKKHLWWRQNTRISPVLIQNDFFRFLLSHQFDREHVQGAPTKEVETMQCVGLRSSDVVRSTR